jgi:hypothetical protein
MDNKGATRNKQMPVGNYDEKCTICEGERVDEVTDVHSGFTRYRTAVATTFSTTTHSVVV